MHVCMYVCLEFKFLCGRPHETDPSLPRPHESTWFWPLTLGVNVINGWPPNAALLHGYFCNFTPFLLLAASSWCIQLSNRCSWVTWVVSWWASIPATLRSRLDQLSHGKPLSTVLLLLSHSKPLSSLLLLLFLSLVQDCYNYNFSLCSRHLLCNC